MQVSCKNRSFTLSAVALSILMMTSVPATAADEAAQADAGEAHRLEAVTVEETKEQSGTTVISSDEIRLMATGTETITDKLRGQSFIQFDVNSRSGMLGGDITPPQISIRGSRHYENSFLINGISNNNTLNPEGYDSTQSYGVRPTGDSQSIILDADLVDSIAVYSENVSAEYGDFLGGVVDAKIRDAKTDRWHGTVSFKHTRDSWAQQHYVDEPTEYPSVTSGEQPEFKRYSTGVVLEGPLFDGRLGAMISYENQRSTIPQYVNYGTNHERQTAKRNNDNFLIKLNTMPDEDFYVNGTLVYAPYTSTSYAPSNKNGEYETEGGGWHFLVNTRANLKFGKWKNDFGISRTELNRDSTSNVMYSWRTVPTGYANWSSTTYSTEGLMGDYDQNQNTLTYKSVLELDPVGPNGFINNIKLGVDAQYVLAKAAQEGYTSYTTPTAASVNSSVEGSYADGIIAGEQYATTKSVLEGDSMRQSYSTLAFFAEDTVTMGRVMVRPGLRMSHDNITSNTNFAPRLFADVDILDDNRFHVTGGYNRYYGSQILAHALYMPSSLQRYTRTLALGSTTPGAWVAGTAPTLTYKDLGNLDTPYSDEFTLGASADVLNTLVKFQAVKREYRDQLRTKATTRTGYAYEMSNDGETDYWGLTLSFEKAFDLGAFGKHRAELGFTRSDLKGNSTDWSSGTYDSAVTSSTLYNPDFVLINGQLTAKSDINAGNFNSDWVITYTHNASFMNDRLRLMALARYETAADRLVATSPSYQTMDGLRVSSYKLEENKALFNVDLTASYDFIKHGDMVCTFEVQALNLFDRKNLSNTSSTATNNGTYSMGRQFYLGLKATY